MTPSVFDEDDEGLKISFIRIPLHLYIFLEFFQDERDEGDNTYRVDMMDRPTPYEMWQKKRSRAARKKKVLNDLLF